MYGFEIAKVLEKECKRCELSMNIKCGFSHNLDLEGTGLLDCPIRQVHSSSLIFILRCAAGSAHPPLTNGELNYLF